MSMSECGGNEIGRGGNGIEPRRSLAAKGRGAGLLSL
jgi:hypothetical protein